MRKKSSPWASLESVIESALKIHDKPRLLQFAKICSGWKKIVGPQLYKASRPQSLSRKVLTIGATEPVWVDSMMYLKGDIILKVNTLFHEPVIKNVKIVHNSDIVENDSEKKENYDVTEKIRAATVLEPEHEVALESIDDDQLRSIFKRVMLKNMGLGSRH